MAYFEDSYSKIDPSEGHIDIIRKVYKHTWDKHAPRQGLFLAILPSLLKPPIFLTQKSLGFSRKEPFVRWAWYKDSMLVHTLLYQNRKGVLTSGNLSGIWRNSINTFVMFISIWKMLKQSGNGSRKAPCVWGWISRMPSSMSPWVPMSRNSFDLNGRGKYTNSKSFILVLNVLHEYWPLWWHQLLSFSAAEALAWRP